MAIYKLLLPKMGESVSEATLTKWVIQVGERIEEDDAVAEIATDKVDSEVPSPVAGILKERLFEENQVIQVGDVIALIEVDGDDDAENSGNVQDENLNNSEQNIEEKQAEHTEESADQEGMDDAPEASTEIPGMDQVDSRAAEDHNQVSEAGSSGIRFYSPLVRNIAQQEGISQQELDGITGTGAEGRVTKQDVLNYIQQKAGSNHIPKVDSASPTMGSSITESRSSVASSSAGSEVKASSGTTNVGQAVTSPAQVVKSSGSDEIIEMDRMRRLIADHMVSSVKTSPHVFSVVEADVTNLVNWRNKIKDAYKKAEGENITFTPLIIEAIAKAIKDFPMVNVSVDGYNIIRKKNINIGMAAALPSGNLIVPVIKNVDQLSLSGISKSVNDLANRARGNKLKPDDTQGGTFTFTNIGAFGNILGMPIINQPQAAILAVGTIKKKPAVLETEYGDVIAVRHMMYISMSYDHRVIDGALGGSFIRRVADYLENWDAERTV
ncbi:dihydrolipoamide acetyltransferase family protein [Sphingobacterium sp. 1.A.4]|uniref:dihydrolipoamide acetyltransferase family protein n=1 Tax=Sphingobacterium sp. 1.A.4 TaxID=2044603 RepID=UPI000C0C0945|nr:dihydrolipoamide acetyltransferase family protein [Sphingobacterium sp. 1.A.4]